MVKHIIIGWYNVLFKRNTKLYKERIKFCKECNKLEKLGKIEYCSLCGCPLQSKLRVPEEQCDLKKW